jgi:DNA-directed RNA polymerase subunit RPC12/RpoP
MNDHDDARIEDAIHWRCPACGAINHGYCGEDEFVCWRCGEKVPEDKLDRDIDWTEVYPPDESEGED